MGKHYAAALFIFVLAVGIFLRFHQITEIPPGLYADEAMNGNNALEALATGDFKIFYPENNGREGLFINLQALSLWLFGATPWALRMVSAVFGTLTILGLYFLTKELLLKSNFNNPRSSTSIALLSSFFLAVSFWHINFSRIGFRAILVPFFAVFGMYFLLKGLRRGKIFDLILAGIFTGLGFYTYIAFRFMPFILAVPLIWHLWQWWKRDPNIRMASELSEYYSGHSDEKFGSFGSLKCIPCAVLLFLFITLMVALPIGFYFLQNPQDFVGRAGDVSIFSAESPIKEFVKSNTATLGMFFARGDCNWRHNYNCQPELNLLVGLFFIIGVAVLTRSAASYKLPAISLLAWLFFMSLPATLTREGLPHALRAIGMIPPVMILAGFGARSLWTFLLAWFEKQKEKRPNYVKQLVRIQREILILGLAILALLPVLVYRDYFIRWANNPNTYFAFSTDLWHLGQYLNGLPRDVKKYVIVNLPGVDIRGIPAPAQTVMFATDTFLKKQQEERGTIYLNHYRGETSIVTVSPLQKAVTAFLNGADRSLINSVKNKFPELKVRVPGDFVILQNY